MDNAKLQYWLKAYERNHKFLEHRNLSAYELEDLRRYCKDTLRQSQQWKQKVEAYNFDKYGRDIGFSKSPWEQTLEAALVEIDHLEARQQAEEIRKPKAQPVTTLSPQTAAVVIWALNEWQPGSVSKSNKGIVQGLQNFAIPVNGKASTVHKHVKEKQALEKPQCLMQAGEWLEKQGFTEAANEAYKLSGDQRRG